MHQVQASGLAGGIAQEGQWRMAAVAKPKGGWSECRRHALQALLDALQRVEDTLRRAGVPHADIQLVTFTNDLCYLLSSLWNRRSIEEAESLLSSAEEVQSSSSHDEKLGPFFG